MAEGVVAHGRDEKRIDIETCQNVGDVTANPSKTRSEMSRQCDQMLEVGQICTKSCPNRNHNIFYYKIMFCKMAKNSPNIWVVLWFQAIKSNLMFPKSVDPSIFSSGSVTLHKKSKLEPPMTTGRGRSW